MTAHGVPTSQQRSIDDRRSEIIQSALLRLARHGFKGLRVRNIAADAGLHPTTLLHYFPDQEALVTASRDGGQEGAD